MERPSRSSKDRVGDRRADGHDPGLSRTGGSSIGRYDMHLYFGHFIDPQNLKVVKVGLIDRATAQREFAAHHAAEAIGDPSFHLRSARPD